MSLHSIFEDTHTFVKKMKQSKLKQYVQAGMFCIASLGGVLSSSAYAQNIAPVVVPTPTFVDDGAPKIKLTRTPSPMIAGQSYTVIWSTTNATSLQWTCTSSGGGFVGSQPDEVLYNIVSGIADPAWVGHNSDCSWTATNDQGQATTVNETLITTSAPVTPTCTSIAPQAASTSALTGSFRVYAFGVANATAVEFPTWGDTNGQDDLVWYQGSNAGNGTWYADVNLANHKAGNPEYGQFNTHVYLHNTSAASSFCSGMNWTRTQVLTAPALSLSNCSSITPTTSPTAASTSCTLSNTGQTAATNISYSNIANVSVTGPTSCAANSSCGTVKVTTANSAGSYTGMLTATPSPSGTASSTGINLTVNPAAAALSAVISPSPLNLTLATAGIASGQLTATPNGGTAPYTFTWSKTAGTRSTLNNTSVSNPTVIANLVANDNFTESWLVTVQDSVNVSTTASANINFKVTAASAPILSFSNCLNTNNPVTAPANASITCTLSNTGQTTATGISYSSISGAQVVGASTCNANSNCGTVTITTTGTTAGTYSGTLTATPTPSGTVASTGISLIVNAAETETITYIHTDGLGSPVAKTNASGARITQTKYEAYGMTVAGSDTPTIGFTGHVNDADTGLTYMQQRYYDPVAARFLSEDPVLTDANTGASFNRYAYAANNPYKYIDPDGRVIETVWDAANVAMDLASLGKNLATGNYVGAAVDFGGLVLDGIATAVPGVPGGAGAAIKASRSADEVLQANKAAGSAFQSKVAAQIKSTNVEVAEEITIKTASGAKTRMDIVSRDAKGNITCTECKASATAPFTKGQTAAHPEIAATGGVVVGKGKPGFPGGTVIPPKPVEVKRPESK